MKRFYCTVCKAVRRVHRLPRNVELVQGPKGPAYSPGTCDWHDGSTPRTTTRAPRPAPVFRATAAVPVAAPSNARKRK